MKFKRLLCILLSVLMMFSMLSVLAFADEPETEATDSAETTDSAESTDSPDTLDEIVIDEAGMTGDGTIGNAADLASFALTSDY